LPCLIGIALPLLLAAASRADEPLPAQPKAIERALKEGKAGIVGLTRHLGPPPIQDGFFARACNNWTLAEADVLYFFAHADALSPEELHTSYDVLPCKYSGSISIDNKLYEFSINVGYFATVRSTASAGSSLYGCKEACKKLFPIDLYGDE
jgi:hypothetical protein